MAYSGRYRGIRFRSLLELSVIRHFEAEGLVIDKDFKYEATVIEYGSRKKRNYIVDLTFPAHKMLIEIKPASRADNRNNRAKRVAAEAWCKARNWEYIIVTEEELRQCGEVLTLEQVANISDVELNERAKRALRRKQAMRKRKGRK